ncbi:hypothetical protein LSCM1_07045 [Leishmania martiniquensis]|uniref:ATP-dependent DNA helicase n=1 Tax=Leishmania martiniquensis TaxID=1580590 RepID=A0A836HF05_9TRYP|nr:hypothetical protein LSCM1_07045 [Leishmania martiniquensis]
MEGPSLSLCRAVSCVVLCSVTPSQWASRGCTASFRGRIAPHKGSCIAPSAPRLHGASCSRPLPQLARRWQRFTARVLRRVPPTGGAKDKKRAWVPTAYNVVAEPSLVRRRRISCGFGNGDLPPLSSPYGVQRASLSLRSERRVSKKVPGQRQWKKPLRSLRGDTRRATDGIQIIRGAPHAAAHAQGTGSAQGAYFTARGAAVHQETELCAGADNTEGEEGALCRLLDSASEHDKLPSAQAAEESAVGRTASRAVRRRITPRCTTSNVLAAERPSASLETASSGASGSGFDPRVDSGKGPHDQPNQSSSVMLDPKQAKALDLALRGCNIFVTGGAGTGKSQTVRAIIAALRHCEAHDWEETLRAVAYGESSTERAMAGEKTQWKQRDPAPSPSPSQCRSSHLRTSEPACAIKSASKSKPYPSSAVGAAPPFSNVFVTATTGLAAVQIHGMTINTFAGIGLGRGTPEQLFRKVQKNSKAAQRWRRCRVLLIDEVSMLEASLFETLDYIARRVRRCASLPFGGIQVILCGDFFQLPPIASRAGPPVVLRSRGSSGRGATEPSHPTGYVDGPLGALAPVASLFASPSSSLPMAREGRGAAAPTAAAAARVSKLFEVDDLDAYLSSLPASPGDAASGSPAGVRSVKSGSVSTTAEARRCTAPASRPSQVFYPEESLDHAAACAFCFQTVAWRKLGLRVVVLERSHRQASDALFRQVLDEVRWGALSMSGYRALASRCVHSSNETCGQAGASASSLAVESTAATAAGVPAPTSIRLCATNSEVDARNAHFYARLPPEHPLMHVSTAKGPCAPAACSTEWPRCYTYRAYDTQTAEATFGTHRLPSTVDVASSYVSDALNDTQLVRILPLKVGTRVLLQSNVASRYRLVNGSVGIVTGFLHPLELLAVTDYFAGCKSRRNSAAAHTTAELALPAASTPPVTAGPVGPPPPPSWVQQLLRRGGFGSGSDVLTCVETSQAADVESLWWRMRRQLRWRNGSRKAPPPPSHRDSRAVATSCRADVGVGKVSHPYLSAFCGSAEDQAQQQPRRIPYSAFFPSYHYAYWRRVVYRETPPGSSPSSEAADLSQSSSWPSSKAWQPRLSQRCLHDLTEAELALERLPVVRFELPAGLPAVGTSASQQQQQQRPAVVYALVSPITQDLSGASACAVDGGRDDVSGSGERAGWGAHDNAPVSAMSTSCRTQIPLRHAWALTVHKSQGLTLHSVQVDMANMRTPGQAYVALSRAPSLDQLTILHFDSIAVTASPEVKRFYEALERDACESR